MALCLWSEALSLLCKFVFAFQYNPICGDIHSESRDGNKHNTSLHLWPPSSSSSLWMRCNNGEEQGRGRKIASLFRCLLMVHKLKDSRFNSDNKSVRKATNPLARSFAHEVRLLIWKGFSPLPKKNGEKYDYKEYRITFHAVGLIYLKTQATNLLSTFTSNYSHVLYMHFYWNFIFIIVNNLHWRTLRSLALCC